MSRKKRYKNSVDIVVQAPTELRDRALKIVALREGAMVRVPYCSDAVPLSMAVLVIRGLEREVKKMEQTLDLEDAGNKREAIDTISSRIRLL